MVDPATAPTSPDTEIGEFSYEEARSALVEIVTRLEQGSIPLEESLVLWERGEALARHCQSWLDGARERLDKAQQVNTFDVSLSDTPTEPEQSVSPSDDPEEAS